VIPPTWLNSSGRPLITRQIAALVAGQQVAAIACERSGEAKVFYARSLDEVKAWAEKVRRGTT
jgi:hypothetical protein